MDTEIARHYGIYIQDIEKYRLFVHKLAYVFTYSLVCSISLDYVSVYKYSYLATP